jgi:transposase-like protein DUF772
MVVMAQQMGFFDLSDCYASLDAKKDPLVEINDVVPWEEFRPLLEQVWRKPESERESRAGRKPLDAVLMFKTLVLSALYNLSDDQVEYQIRDRLSFMPCPAGDACIAERWVFGPRPWRSGAGRNDRLVVSRGAGASGQG